jgi:DNA-binding Lrp family transcriptional regulator
MIEAFVLIQTEVGKAPEVAMDLTKLSGVTSALNVSGPYDVIAEVRAEDMDELGQLVVSRVQSVAGITRTLTCPIIRISNS